MWTFKYKPKSVKDIIGLNDSVINNLTLDMKHMMLVSRSPGTGKTSTASIIQEHLGLDSSDVLWLNGSDSRGIDTIRNTVKEFAMTMSNSHKIRLIRIEEADQLTDAAQKMLRELVERYEKNCRFVFTVNYLEKIIEPLRSRCMVIDFNKPDKLEIKMRLAKICLAEKVEIQHEALNLLVDKYYPDIRSMINKLEELSLKSKVITAQLIKADDDKIKNLYNLLQGMNSSNVDKKFAESRAYFMESSYEPAYVLEMLYAYVVKNKVLANDKLLNFCEVLGECFKDLKLSLDNEVMISACIVRLIKVLK